MITNTAHRETEDWIAQYSIASSLQKPEEIVLEKLKNKLPTLKMLDIGIGGGRTTCHFAPLAGQYVGIDFDEGMIQACTRRFPNPGGKVSFKVCDAKSMEMFDNDYFDFILFSFNGLDYLSHDHRLKALREIRRVGRAGGYFLFSSHNLRRIDRLFAGVGVSDILVQFRSNPVKFLRQIYVNPALLKPLWKYLSLRCRNPSIWDIRKVSSRDYAIIYDGVYSFTLKSFLLSIWRNLGHYYYIKPEIQIEQLKEIGFKVLDVYACDTRFDARWVDHANELPAVTDCWLYYFCEIADCGARSGTSTAVASV